MHSNSPTPHKKARIEIIPLIDIMFFLLASFMLVSLSLVKLQGAKVDLPPAGKPMEDKPLDKPDLTTVSVEKTGNIVWLNSLTKVKESLNADTLLNHARELFAKNKEAKVFVNADNEVPYGDVLTVMDRVRRSGLTKVTFATKAYTGSPVAGAAAAAPGAPAAPAPAAPTAPGP